MVQIEFQNFIHETPQTKNFYLQNKFQTFAVIQVQCLRELCKFTYRRYFEVFRDDYVADENEYT
jgi:hypothetical protein